jgi:hypothetical protein
MQVSGVESLRALLDVAKHSWGSTVNAGIWCGIGCPWPTGSSYDCIGSAMNGGFSHAGSCAALAAASEDSSMTFLRIGKLS